MKRSRKMDIVVDALIDSKLIRKKKMLKTIEIVRDAFVKIEEEEQEAIQPQGSSCVTTRRTAKETYKSNNAILELRQSDKGDNEIWLNGKRLQNVSNYKIEKNHPFFGPEISLKMPVAFAKKQEDLEKEKECKDVREAGKHC